MYLYDYSEGKDCDEEFSGWVGLKTGSKVITKYPNMQIL
jgi:hypothetical protein